MDNRFDFSSLRDPLVQTAISIHNCSAGILSEQKLDKGEDEINPDYANISKLALSLQTDEFNNLLSRAKSMVANIPNKVDRDILSGPGESFLDCIQSAAQELGWNWDSVVGKHSHRVGRNASIIAGELGIQGDALGEYYWAGVFHDIGKLLVNGFVRTLEEKQADRQLILLFVRTHASLGGHLLKHLSPLFPKAAVFAFEHQEDIDGTGYPKGLTLDQLTTEGRIAHFADSYDALVTRTGWSAARVCDAFQEKYRNIHRSEDAILKAFLLAVEKTIPRGTWMSRNRIIDIAPKELRS